jgi:hypothetical protein
MAASRHQASTALRAKDRPIELFRLAVATDLHSRIRCQVSGGSSVFTERGTNI